MRTSIDTHDVSTLRLMTHKSADGSSTWVTIEAVGKDGKSTEFSFWAVKDCFLPIVIGEE